jgi:SMODS domain-containing protein
MNFNPKSPRPAAMPDLVDILLADVAIRIQLSKTDHDKAVDRFGVMQDWIDRESSPLRGLVKLMYPQGSMAIGATVSRVSEKDEFDIDVVVNMAIRHDADPQTVLDTLHDAIRGERGSRYWGATTRHTRCICVSYEDGMHIDLTPAVLQSHLTPRTSIIFHSKPEDHTTPDRRLLANPWGLGEWFKLATPADADFGSFFEKRAMDHFRAPAEPVPDQEPAYRKSRALIALQLIKRWRNVLFTRRDRANLRWPPSVLLVKFVGDNANRTRTLAEEVEHQAQCILARLAYETAHRRLVHEVNPCCSEDVLTDRWPGNFDNQLLMISDLRAFILKIQALRSGSLALDGMSKILEELFGQRPARKAVADYIASAPSGGNRVVTSTGRILGLTSSVATPALARPVPPHTFFGD